MRHVQMLSRSYILQRRSKRRDFRSDLKVDGQADNLIDA